MAPRISSMIPGCCAYALLGGASLLVHCRWSSSASLESTAGYIESPQVRRLPSVARCAGLLGTAATPSSAILYVMKPRTPVSTCRICKRAGLSVRCQGGVPGLHAMATWDASDHRHHLCFNGWPSSAIRIGQLLCITGPMYAPMCAKSIQAWVYRWNIITGRTSSALVRSAPEALPEAW